MLVMIEVKRMYLFKMKSNNNSCDLPEENWQVWKTFVSRDLIKPSQDETENEILNDLYFQLETELKSETNNRHLLHRLLSISIYFYQCLHTIF